MNEYPEVHLGNWYYAIAIVENGTPRRVLFCVIGIIGEFIKIECPDWLYSESIWITRSELFGKYHACPLDRGRFRPFGNLVRKITNTYCTHYTIPFTRGNQKQPR